MTEPKCQLPISQLQSSRTYNYLCLQQPQTLDFLNFIAISNCQDKQIESIVQSKQKQIVFCPQQANKSTGFSKKERIFKFDKIHKRNQKFRHAFDQDIRRLVNSVLEGHNHSIFIYGSEQSEKNKILIGESQNPGILLLLFSQLFQTCRQRQLEAKATIKLSAFVQKSNKFLNIFEEDDVKGLLLEDDVTQIGFFIGVPQIIIRNIKTAMKCINLIWKKILQNRGKDSNATQNVFFTIKLEIEDMSSTILSSSQQSKFCISKINIVKLANPAVIDYHKIDKSKTQKWYIDLFNYLQQNTIQKYISNTDNSKENQKTIKYGQKNFIEYIKKVILTGVSSINCFTSLTNKICSNQCFSSLIFTNYLGQFSTKPTFKFLDFDELQSLKLRKQNQIRKQLIESHNDKEGIYYVFKNRTKFSNQQLLDSGICKILLQIFQLHQAYLQQANILEYEYSNTISEGCTMLGKYLLSQQIQQFYYSKKIFIEPNYQLKRIRMRLNELKQQLHAKQHSFFKCFTEKAKQMIYELQTNNLTNSSMLLKSDKKIQKKIVELENLKYSYELFFKICNTLTSHYAFSTNQQLKIQLEKMLTAKNTNQEKQLKVIQKQIQPQIKQKTHSLPKILTNNQQKILNTVKTPFKPSNPKVKQTVSFYQTCGTNLEKKLNSNKKIGWKKYQEFIIQKINKEKMSQAKILSFDETLATKNATLQDKKNIEFIFEKRDENELNLMFTNTNVGIRSCKFKKMI